MNAAANEKKLEICEIEDTARKRERERVLQISKNSITTGQIFGIDKKKLDSSLSYNTYLMITISLFLAA